MVRPLSTVKYTSVVYSNVDSGLTNLIHDRYSCTLQRHSYLGCSRLAGCVHSSVNKPGANGRVSYSKLQHVNSLQTLL